MLYYFYTSFKYFAMEDDLNVRRYIPYIFNYETTMRNDYRRPRIDNSVLTVYKTKKPFICLHHPDIKDMQTLTPRRPKNSYIPFHLYHKRKGIIDTDPKDIQKPFFNLEDVDRKEVQKTRPRVYITPAISLDDANEPHRQILMKSVYSTETSRAMNCNKLTSKCIKAPLSENYAPCDVMTIPCVRVPYVSPEWRMRSVPWESKQLRGYVDATKTFWLKKDVSKQ